MTARARAGVLVATLGLAAACQRAPAPAAPPPAPQPTPRPAPAPPSSTASPSKPSAAPPADDEGALVEEPPERDPRSETVTIKLSAEPARKAHVYWGRKDLGLAPLELTRPRNSGPLDLTIVTPGALTLHTRVFTDRDDKLSLHLYAEGEAPGMLGYRPPE